MLLPVPTSQGRVILRDGLGSQARGQVDGRVEDGVGIWGAEGNGGRGRGRLRHAVDIEARGQVDGCAGGTLGIHGARGSGGWGQGRSQSNPTASNFDLNLTARGLDLNRPPDLDNDIDQNQLTENPTAGALGCTHNLRQSACLEQPNRGRGRGRGKALPQPRGESSHCIGGFGRTTSLVLREDTAQERNSAQVLRGRGRSRGKGRTHTQPNASNCSSEFGSTQGRGTGRARGRPRTTGRGRGIGRGRGVDQSSSSDEQEQLGSPRGPRPPEGWVPPAIEPTVRSPHCLRRPRTGGLEHDRSPQGSVMEEGATGARQGSPLQNYSPNSALGHHRRRQRLTSER